MVNVLRQQHRAVRIGYKHSGMNMLVRAAVLMANKPYCELRRCVFLKGDLSEHVAFCCDACIEDIVSVYVQVNAQLRFAPEAKISSRCSAITMQVHDEVMNDWYGRVGKLMHTGLCCRA
jgi:hypothetical protein